MTLGQRSRSQRAVLWKWAGPRVRRITLRLLCGILWTLIGMFPISRWCVTYDTHDPGLKVKVTASNSLNMLLLLHHDSKIQGGFLCWAVFLSKVKLAYKFIALFYGTSCFTFLSSPTMSRRPLGRRGNVLASDQQSCKFNPALGHESSQNSSIMSRWLPTSINRISCKISGLKPVH